MYMNRFCTVLLARPDDRKERVQIGCFSPRASFRPHPSLYVCWSGFEVRFHCIAQVGFQILGSLESPLQPVAHRRGCRYCTHHPQNVSNLQLVQAADVEPA